MNPNGIARADIDVVDLSVLINTGLKGIYGSIQLDKASCFVSNSAFSLILTSPIEFFVIGA